MSPKRNTMRVAAFVALALLVAVSGAFALRVGPFSETKLKEAWQDPQFHIEAGYLLGEQGEWAAARREFMIATQLDPASVTARRDLAVASFHAGDYAGAIGAYRALLRQDPASSEYRFDLAQSLVAHARGDDADPDVAVSELHEAADLLESVGEYPHAGENAAIIREVLSGAGV